MKKRQINDTEPQNAKVKIREGFQFTFNKLEAANRDFLRQSALLVAQDLAKKQQEHTTTVCPTGASLAEIDGEELKRRHDRRLRFKSDAKLQNSKGQRLVEAGTAGTGRVLGQNTSLEKEYLRLTSLPTVSEVRPPQVLRQALELVKQKWVQENDYKYSCEQLKSIRQDLTVQHIRSSLTVQVYETHARIAIEVGDWAEYKQCDAVLQALYDRGHQGETPEFKAYGLLYAAAAGNHMLCHEMKEVLTCPELSEDVYIKHALAVCSSYSCGSYIQFLKLYDGAPRMAAYLMDLLLSKIQHKAYGVIVSAYLPSVPKETLKSWLGIASTAFLNEFLSGKGAALNSDGANIDIRASRAALARS